MSVLGFQRRRIDPDPPPTPEPPSHHSPYPPDPEPACACGPFDGHGQNPECAEHPWWRHDPHVLHLADLTRELGSALAAARAIDWKTGS